jgi:hypothetical protein
MATNQNLLADFDGGLGHTEGLTIAQLLGKHREGDSSCPVRNRQLVASSLAQSSC